MKDRRDLKELIAEVIQVQDACNLSGVVHGWSRSMSRLKELFPNKDTEFFNNHPINRLWADKVFHMTRKYEISEAYKAIHEMIKEK